MINVSVIFQKAIIRHGIRNIRTNEQCFALWDVTQRRLVIADVLGQPVFPKQSKEDGTDKLFRNVGKNTNHRCIILLNLQHGRNLKSLRKEAFIYIKIIKLRGGHAFKLADKFI
jgi:hypothetical protein